MIDCCKQNREVVGKTIFQSTDVSKEYCLLVHYMFAKVELDNGKNVQDYNPARFSNPFNTF